MYSRKVFILALICICGLASCNEPEPVSSLLKLTDNLEKFAEGHNKLTVLTRNVYVGGDVDQILLAENPNDIPVIVASVFQSILTTNFHERAEALADEIYQTKPHLVGLQEISLFRVQSPGDYLVGGSVLAEDVVLDHLEVLMEALRNRGLSYNVVAKIENADIELPMVTSAVPTFDDIRLTDYDVILARGDVEISDIIERNYEAKVVIPELGVEFPRGYVAVSAKHKGCKYTFINTHLEDADQGGILIDLQLAQTAELLSFISEISNPVVLVGDLNSAAMEEPSYSLISSSPGFVDSWLMNKDVSNLEGYTYGNDFDLRNENPTLYKRIDHIFVREGQTDLGTIKLHKVFAEVLGDEISDKTESGMWPSDHAGVVASLKFKKIKDN